MVLHFFHSNVACAIGLIVAASCLIGIVDAQGPCSTPYANSLSIKCFAVDGETEAQFPKDPSLPTYAPEGTDCNDILVPSVVDFVECLRTVQFDFHWTYLGTDDVMLGNVYRSITNSLGVYPEETVGMVKSVWGSMIVPGTSLKDTCHQIVVDICYEPIKYTYSLEVSLDKPDGSFCLDTAIYEYEIGANEKENGYSAFQPQAAAEEETLGCKSFDDGMEPPTKPEPSAEMAPAPSSVGNPSAAAPVAAPVVAPVVFPTNDAVTDPPEVEPTDAPSSTSGTFETFSRGLGSLYVFLCVSAALSVY